MKTLLLGTIIGTKQDVAKPILADTATSARGYQTSHIALQQNAK